MMITTVEDIHKRIAAAQELRAVRFVDEHGTPDRELPACPVCAETAWRVRGRMDGAWFCEDCEWSCAFSRELDA